jgi:glycosyltransferase involved in cell wall biosynthesis
MRISHIFHHFNTFGGAEEHITKLAELQKANGYDVNVCLIQTVAEQNQYVQRLKLAGIVIYQWPLWFSRIISDWETRESILRQIIFYTTPLIFIIVSIVSRISNQSRTSLRASVEGRLRTLLSKHLFLSRERQLFILMLNWLYFRHKPDVLHMHSYGAGLEYVLQWANEHNSAVVYQEHSTPDLTNRRMYALPLDLNLADIIVAVSDTSAQALRKYCGVTRPIEVIPPIASVERQKARVECKYTLDTCGVNILTIARLSEEKGLSFLIQAAELVLKQKANVQFSIYGDGPLLESLEEEINAAQMVDHVYLIGGFKHNELPDIMSKADIFLLPSITEGMPLTIIEAMGYGCPIVATSVGGIPELIQDGVNGLLCDPANPESIAEKINILIDNPDLRRRMGSEARKSYEQGSFQPSLVCEKFLSIYQDTLHRQSVSQIERDKVSG